MLLPMLFVIVSGFLEMALAAMGIYLKMRFADSQWKQWLNFVATTTLVSLNCLLTVYYIYSRFYVPGLRFLPDEDKAAKFLMALWFLPQVYVIARYATVNRCKVKNALMGAHRR